jgi:hypothetical protein
MAANRKAAPIKIRKCSIRNSVIIEVVLKPQIRFMGPASLSGEMGF